MTYGDPAQYISNLYVDESCLDSTYTREIIERSGLQPTVLRENRHPDLDGEYPANMSRGKKVLHLCKNRGRFFKPCPGTREYNCCGYHVLNTGMNCPMDCVYCILQAYLNNPWISFFINIDDMLTEIRTALTAEPEKLFRIGTGEFTDSLALDSFTGLSSRLVDFMGRQRNGFLELKTKSASVENLRNARHNGRTIVSWSVNAPEIMRREEIRTASLDERLAAASRCARWGYRLAFHFDPVIWHPGWEEGYRYVIEQIFAAVPGEKIAWISLGALRFLPHLKETASLRFPHSRFFYEEFVEGLDGKSRYFHTQRLEMYRFITGELRRRVAQGTCLYFCMESDAVWKNIFGFAPPEKGGLAALLDRALATP